MVGVQGWRIQSRPGESNGAMVRGSARNSVVGRAERLRSMSGGLGMQPRGIERRTMGAGPERDMGGPERTADGGRADEQTSRGPGKGCRGKGGGAIWSSPALECQNAKLASRGIS